MSSSCASVESEFSGQKHHATLKLVIKDFLFYKERTEHIESSRIKLRDLGLEDYHEEWLLFIVPCYSPNAKGRISRNDGREEKNYVTISCVLANVDPSTRISAFVQLDVLNVNGTWSSVLSRTSRIFSRGTECSWGRLKGLSHEEVFADNSQYLVDGNLTIKAEIDFICESAAKLVTLGRSNSDVDRPCEQAVFYRNHVQRSAEMYSNKNATDFTLISKDKKRFQVHRFILMAHSPVFSAMLKRNTAEDTTRICNIPDVEGETLDILLEFMYSSSSSRLNEGNVVNVLKAADKYDMTDLRLACEQFLVPAINIHNAAALLVMADRRNMAKLEKLVLNFISNNVVSFFKDGCIDKIQTYNPTLLNKVLLHIRERNGGEGNAAEMADEIDD